MTRTTYVGEVADNIECRLTHSAKDRSRPFGCVLVTSQNFLYCPGLSFLKR